jgi:NAD(P)H dehydrogenase (quinone)
VHALIVTAHPLTQSFTHAVARRLADGVEDAGHTAEIADLAREGFDPRFTATDIARFLQQGPADADVLAEQARIDRADALALVYPVYWWSMPGLLKGWIDRVFSQGWAYQEREGRDERRLGRLSVHLLAIGGADMRTYARHGYFGAMRTQIDHGIFEYCGARVSTSELLAPLGDEAPARHLATAFDIGRRLFAPHRERGLAEVA